jgi:hypothetical protein
LESSKSALFDPKTGGGVYPAKIAQQNQQLTNSRPTACLQSSYPSIDLEVLRFQIVTNCFFRKPFVFTIFCVAPWFFLLPSKIMESRVAFPNQEFSALLRVLCGSALSFSFASSEAFKCFDIPTLRRFSARMLVTL